VDGIFKLNSLIVYPFKARAITSKNEKRSDILMITENYCEL
jgi:hypothetical protein